MNNNAELLLAWYQAKNYIFPWRKTKNPYAIWVSEIMLQQTQIKTVVPYYKNWMNIFPSSNSVACSSLDKILKAWEGLGYYRRAENLFKSSKIIKEQFGGQLPRQYRSLMNLPGIGDYTASAILAIVYNKKYPAIDGNVRRVLSRFLMINKKNQPVVFFKSIINKNFKTNYFCDLTQAFMDLGREVCRPVSPLCSNCPLAPSCAALISGRTHDFPIKTKKKAVPLVRVVVGLIYNTNNQFLISKRAPGGLLGGLWELPGGKIEAGEQERAAMVREASEELDFNIITGRRLGFVNHKYSHFHVNIVLFKCSVKTGSRFSLRSSRLRWISYKEINRFAFPSATHKLFKLIKNDY